MINSEQEINTPSEKDSKGSANTLQGVGSLLLLFLIGMTPLLNRMVVVETTQLDRMLTNQLRYFDLFGFFKSQCALSIGAVALLLLLLLALTRQLSTMDWKMAGAALLFMAMTILSTALSPVQGVAITGLFDRYEGAGVWICYLLTFLLGAAAMKQQRDWRGLQAALYFMLCFQLVLGISQFFRMNILDTPIVRSLIMDPKLVEFYKIGTLSGEGSVYGTVNNPNFYSQTLALLAVLPLTSVVLGKGKWFPRILLGVTGMVLAFTNCSGGFFGFAAGTFVVYSMVGSERKLNRVDGLLLAPLLCAGIISLLGVKVVSTGDILLCAAIPAAAILGQRARQHVAAISSMSKQKLLAAMAVLLCGLILFAAVPNAHEKKVQALDIVGNRLTVDYPMGRLILETDADNSVSVLGSDGHLLLKGLKQDSVKIEALDEVLNITPENGFARIELKRLGAKFSVVEGNIYALDSRYQPMVLDNPESWGFDGRETFGSGRGFIWSRSLPLLKRTLVWGVGPDVFPFVFPQRDYVGKINFGSPNILVDKPHNWFLQVALGTGFLSLAALLYIWKRIWHYGTFAANQRACPQSVTIGITAISFLTVYMVSGLLYDSVISVSLWVWPTFGAFVGLLSGGSQFEIDDCAIPKVCDQSNSDDVDDR